MKPVWILDDDQSIRWVLEKALTRENIPHKSFSNPNTSKLSTPLIIREAPP
jgi:two-component system nitrogen regulation response regulator GlnG